MTLISFFLVGAFDAISEGKDASVKYFNDWTEEVKQTVPEEKLLIFSVKEGWEPLCKFLDLPVPNCPFPNTNDSKAIQRMYQRTKMIAYAFVFGVPLILGIISYYLWSMFL